MNGILTRIKERPVTDNLINFFVIKISIADSNKNKFTYYGELIFYPSETVNHFFNIQMQLAFNPGLMNTLLFYNEFNGASQ
jgi:hypothetical protein